MNANDIKVILSVALLFFGSLSAVLFIAPVPHSIDGDDGLIIDYGNWNTDWAKVELSSFDDSFSLLENVCSSKKISLTIDENIVTEINGVVAHDDLTWNFWIIERGEMEWKKASADAKPSNYLCCAWAITVENQIPSLALDAVGNRIYGHKQSQRVVSMTPAITEIIGSLNAVSTLVGVDQYSHYPHSVDNLVKSKDIALTGGYVNPSFEAIIDTDPDAVFGDSSQYMHLDVHNKLRKNGYPVYMLMDGEDIHTIMENIFIVGRVMGYDMTAKVVIDDLTSFIHLLSDKVSHITSVPSTLISLSADKSPWLAGNHTYVDDTVKTSGGSNCLSDYDGWSNTNAEIISDRNPEIIIILMSTYDGEFTDYDTILKNMSKEWKSTRAYINGEVYIFTDAVADFSQRPSPRVGQLTELIARIIHPEFFDDGIVMPKLIGDDYEDYLNYTKYMGYDN